MDSTHCPVFTPVPPEKDGCRNDFAKDVGLARLRMSGELARARARLATATWLVGELPSWLASLLACSGQPPISNLQAHVLLAGPRRPDPKEVRASNPSRPSR